jgi:hypothetical protein
MRTTNAKTNKDERKPLELIPSNLNDTQINKHKIVGVMYLYLLFVRGKFEQTINKALIT